MIRDNDQRQLEFPSPTESKGNVTQDYAVKRAKASLKSPWLIKVGARVTYHARRWRVHVVGAFPPRRHYRAVLGWQYWGCIPRWLGL